MNDVEYKKANLNNYIKFKPTSYGLEVFPMLAKEIGEDGYVVMQMWHFASQFGKHMYNGSKTLMEMTVFIEVKKEDEE